MNSEERKAILRKRFKQARKAFNGDYSTQLNDLMGLPREELESVMPGTSSTEIYDKLISVVKEASAKNISQADLLEDIKELGETAVKIAKKVPSLAAIF
jgi:hypothetical protein